VRPLRSALLSALIGLSAYLPARAEPADDRVRHRLQPGETPAELARRYGVEERSLQRVPRTTTETGAWDAPSSALGGDAGGHTDIPVIVIPKPPEGWPAVEVAPHQTLWRLCKQYGAVLEEVRQVNHLEGDAITVGQRLMLPGSHPSPAPLPLATEPPTQVLPLPPSTSPSGSPSSPSYAPPLSSPTIPTSPTSVPPQVSALPRWLPVQLPDKTQGWVLASLALVPAREPQGPQRVLEIAQQLVGTPYMWGGTSPNGADCSGFVQEVFRLAGLALPRTADIQFTATQAVEAGELKPGDLVFFSTYEPGPSHVGIYAGEGRFVHASSSRGVTYSSLREPYYAQRFLGGHRLAAWITPAAPLSHESR
jgi:cell wall-associated NlpC family hydrolase